MATEAEKGFAAGEPSNKQKVLSRFFWTVISSPNTLSNPDNTHLPLVVTTSQQQLAKLDRPDWQLDRPGPPWLTGGQPAHGEMRVIQTRNWTPGRAWFLNQQAVVQLMSVSASGKLLLRSYSRVQADLHTRIFFCMGWRSRWWEINHGLIMATERLLGAHQSIRLIGDGPTAQIRSRWVTGEWGGTRTLVSP